MLTIAPSANSSIRMAQPATATGQRIGQPAFRMPTKEELRPGKPRAAEQTLHDAEATLGDQRVREIDEQAKQLEGVFMRMLMRRIQGSLGKTGFGQSSQSEFLQSMAFDEMGNAMAGGRHQGIGLGRMIYEVLVRDEAAKGRVSAESETQIPA